MSFDPQLEKLDLNQKILLLVKIAKNIGLTVASDEEWNQLYAKWDIQLDNDTGRPVIFGY